MPKQKGIFQIVGTINGVCYYKRNGEFISRKAVGPSKERIANDPAFKPVKQNNQEFGMASHFSKAIRQGLPSSIARCRDTHMASRMSGICRKIIQKGSGDKGEREANLHNCPEALIGFELNKHHPFSEAYLAIPQVSINQDRSRASISIEKSSPNQLRICPSSATHFQLTATLSLVPNYQWQPEIQQYQTDYPESIGLSNTKYTKPLSCHTEHLNINLRPITPTLGNLPPDLAITIWLGISYLHFHQKQFQPLSSQQAAQCIAVL